MLLNFTCSLVNCTVLDIRVNHNRNLAHFITVVLSRFFFLHSLLLNMYLLTMWEGRTGKYLARGQDVRTEDSEVRTSRPRAKYFPVRSDLTQSISILSYDNLVLKILKILFEPK